MSNNNKNRTRTQSKCNKKGKSYRNEVPSKAIEASEDMKFGPRKGGNDASWYAADSALLRDAASFPFSWATGTKIDLGPGANPTTPYVVPGINVLYLAPNCGYADEPNSPINVAATATYSFVRHANSGHANYDSPDLMIYILAMSQVYSYINFLMRVYGCATLFAQRNRYLPEALLKAQGIQASSVQNNLANFRLGINVLINKAASLSVPANMTLFPRHAFLYQNIYTEGASMKDQLYMYSPAGFWKFTSPTTVGGLTYVPFWSPGSGNSLSWEGLLEYGNNLLDPILRDEDMNIMSGDILKAYGDNTIKLQSLNEDYPIQPVFDAAVLEQMQNATVYDMTVMPNTFDITQVTDVDDPRVGSLIHKPQMQIPQGSSVPGGATNHFRLAWVEIASLMRHGAKVLTTAVAESSPELVIELSRLITTGIPSDNGTQAMYVVGGSEICVSAAIWCFDDKGVLRYTSYGTEHVDVIDPSSAELAFTGIHRNSRLLSLLSSFKFHPNLRQWDVLQSYSQSNATGWHNTSGPQSLFYHFDNYAVLNTQDITKLHEAALLNMLHVPSVSKLK